MAFGAFDVDGPPQAAGTLLRGSQFWRNPVRAIFANAENCHAGMPPEAVRHPRDSGQRSPLRSAWV